jgi:hypothetical protein
MVDNTARQSSFQISIIVGHGRYLVGDISLSPIPIMVQSWDIAWEGIGHGGVI